MKSIMMICTCEKCRYTFRYPIQPLTCPDCGSSAVRPTNEKEKKDFHREQKILAKEIQLGLYAV